MMLVSSVSFVTNTTTNSKKRLRRRNRGLASVAAAGEKNDSISTSSEEELYDLYKLRRAKGLPVDGEYFSAKMRMLVKRDYPDSKFVGSNPWIQKFTRRFGISLQSKTNKKSKSIEERVL